MTDEHDALDTACAFQADTLGPAEWARTVARLRDAPPTRCRPAQGVVFDARSWLITPQRR
jgi:hypothetical protein